MLQDMLEPPAAREDDDPPDADLDEEETRGVAECASAFIDEGMDPIENSEEWHATMEAEAMKGPKRYMALHQRRTCFIHSGAASRYQCW